ncbi:TPA: hypothetical protein U5D73_004562 [Yersinia enterocolitica]|nr:hypothetical protein [Yersinia enterocolitica]
MVQSNITVDEFEILLTEEEYTDIFLGKMRRILAEIRPAATSFLANSDELIQLAMKHSPTYIALSEDRKESFNNVMKQPVFFCSDPHTIVLDLNSEHRIFEDIETYLGGIGRIVFNDDTQQFVDELGKEFSPRLSECELAKFCTENINKYECFYNENISLILRCETPEMKPFW